MARVERDAKNGRRSLERADTLQVVKDEHIGHVFVGSKAKGLLLFSRAPLLFCPIFPEISLRPGGDISAEGGLLCPRDGKASEQDGDHAESCGPAATYGVRGVERRAREPRVHAVRRGVLLRDARAEAVLFLRQSHSGDEQSGRCLSEGLEEHLRPGQGRRP